MAIDLKPLIDRAFYREEIVENATIALERAAEAYRGRFGTVGASLEFVVPRDADDEWALEQLLRRIVYYCDSVGVSLPGGAGVFVALFEGARLSCVTVEDVVDWARECLGLAREELEARYGTHELDTGLR
jgi:hypothetical protein